MRTVWSLLIIGLLFNALQLRCFADSGDSKETSHTLRLMPWPGALKSGSGQLPIDTSFSVGIKTTGDAHLQRAIYIFLDDLRRHTGMLQRDYATAYPPQA